MRGERVTAGCYERNPHHESPGSCPGATARLGGPAVPREPESYGERKKARPSHAMTACGRACVVSTSVLVSLPRPRLLKPGSRARARGGGSAPGPDSCCYQLPAIPATPAAASTFGGPEQESGKPDHQDHEGNPPEDVYGEPKAAEDQR